MSIQVNTGANAVNWESLLSSLGEVEKTKDVNGKAALTLTMKVDGGTKTCTIAVPNDLEVPQMVDAASLDTLVAKLKDVGLELTTEQLATFKEAVNKGYATAANALAEAKAGSGKRGVMFDLYALMALLVEVAQKQRDASREMRNSENSAVRSAIQRQADEQRQAANLGLIIGCTCGAVSAAASLGMMVGQGFAASKQSSIAEESEFGVVGMKSDMMKAVESPEQAANQLSAVKNDIVNEFSVRKGVLLRKDDSMGKGLTEGVTNDFNETINTNNQQNPGETLESRYVDAKDKLTTASGEVDTAKNNVANAKAEQRVAEDAVTTAETNYNNAKAAAQLDEKQATFDGLVKDKDQIIAASERGGKTHEQAVAEYNEHLSAAQTNLDNAKASVRDNEQALATAKDNLKLKQAEVSNAESNLANKNAALTQAEKNLDTAKSEYVTSVKNFAEKYVTKYKDAVQRQRNPPEGVSSDTLAADVKKAKAEMKMARAIEVDALAKNDVLTKTERSTLVTEASNEADTAVNRLNQNEEYKAAGNRIQLLLGLNGIFQAIGGTLQSMTQNISALRQAEATRQGASQTEQQEMLDQTKDLFAQAQKLIDAVVQLMNAVRQAETQSMRDAIQA